TNAHVILEEAPAADEETEEAEPPVVSPVIPWVVSARSAGALVAQAGRLAEFVGSQPLLEPVDVGYSSAVLRAALEHRAVVFGGDRDELVGGLRAVAAGEPVANAVIGVAGGLSAWVFSGQGAQRLGMGRELHAAFAVFATAFDEVCA
ncbi:CurL C-terminal domain-containing protein, partial [Streptomyces tendae]